MNSFGQGILAPHQDLLGQALKSYWQHGEPATVALESRLGQEDHFPIYHMFRAYEDMPELEQFALSLTRGSILDIGAGAGCHTLELQKNSEDVRALDISPLIVETMQSRGVRHTALGDIFHYRDQAYDTLLLLMNGIGLAGSLDGLRFLLRYFHNIVKHGGQVIFDSSDVSYVRERQEPSTPGYFGEMQYRYSYKGKTGNWFPWLYIDPEMLLKIAHETHWHAQVVYEDDHDQYLCRLTRLEN